MKCLVLGSEGFIGKNLIPSLLEEGYEVVTFPRPNDFRNTEDLSRALEGCEVVFHLISSTIPRTSNIDPVSDVNTNLASTLNMLEQCRKGSVKKIIFTSSGGTVYGPSSYSLMSEEHSTNPICSYGIVKLAIEKYLEMYRQLYGLDYTILRLSNPYGPHQKISSGQGVIGVFLDQILKGESVKVWGDGENVRDYIFVGDVVEALMKSINYIGDLKLFNIGSGLGYSVNQILEVFENILNQKINRTYVNARSFDVKVNVLDITRARRKLFWQPNISLEEGVKLYLDSLGLQKNLI